MNTLRDYYTEMGVDIDSLLRLNSELKISDNATTEQLIQHSTTVKRQMMAEAENSTINHNFKKKFIEKDSRKSDPLDISKWPGEFTHYYTDNDLIVGAIKPGKEAGIDYQMNCAKKCKCSICEDTVAEARLEGKKMESKGKTGNIHDMLPVILSGRTNLAAKITYTRDQVKVSHYTPWTLSQIAKPLEYMLIQRLGRFGVEIFGSILFRSAFNLDHYSYEDTWRMGIPRISLEMIENILPAKKLRFSDGDVPTEFSVSSLLYFFDILGINEDIKVHAKGRVSDFKDPVTWREHDKGKIPSKLAYNGRTNTLLTYCEMIAVMLNRGSVGDSIIGYQRGGGMYPFKVESLGVQHAFEKFPLLSPNFAEMLDQDVTKDLSWLHSARN